ncbi:hypothetical protein MBLNU230_g2614t1 [Neophaeotheca triangularis]
MSDRPPEQGPPHDKTREPNYPQRGPQALSASQPSYAQSTTTSAGPSPANQRQSYGTGRPLELPPLPQAPSGTGGSFSPSAIRPVGLPSLLSGTQAEESIQSRRRKAGELESPSLPSLPPLMNPSERPENIPSQPSYGSSAESMGRPRLTPRSPSLHRAASLSHLNQPTATRDAQRSPFLASPHSRSYMAEPGTFGVPQLPDPPSGIRASHAFPPGPQYHHQKNLRRASQSGTKQSRGASSSASPGTSYSGYSREHTSPHEQYVSAGPATSGEQRMGIPISSSSGQNVYQMMTLETTSGTVQLPVDVQAASRVSDEKRKRNAGASARFRQRRKEKEKEASTTISKLEQQVKELTEDAEFYKRERDYLAGVMLQVPGGDRHFPRPPSPHRHRRGSGAFVQNLASGSYPQPQEQMVRGPPEGERNVRRRTSTFALQPLPSAGSLLTQSPSLQPPFGGQNIYSTPSASRQQQQQQPQPLPQQQQPPQPQRQPHPQQHSSQMQHAPQIQAPGAFQTGEGGRLSLPSPAALAAGPPHQQQGAPPQLLQAQPQTGPWNPYAAERRPRPLPSERFRDPRDSRDPREGP